MTIPNRNHKQSVIIDLTSSGPVSPYFYGVAINAFGHDVYTGRRASDGLLDYNWSYAATGPAHAIAKYKEIAPQSIRYCAGYNDYNFRYGIGNYNTLNNFHPGIPAQGKVDRIEPADFGTDELMRFCETIGSGGVRAEPIIIMPLNAFFGGGTYGLVGSASVDGTNPAINFTLSAQHAANWVEYCNGTSPGMAWAAEREWEPTGWTNTIGSLTPFIDGVTFSSGTDVSFANAKFTAKRDVKSNGYNNIPGRSDNSGDPSTWTQYWEYQISEETVATGGLGRKSWTVHEVAPDGYFAWLREQYGHTLPYNVTYWEIGNEPFYSTAFGGTGGGGVPSVTCGNNILSLMKVYSDAMRPKSPTPIKLGIPFYGLNNYWVTENARSLANPEYGAHLIQNYATGATYSPYVDTVVSHLYVGRSDPMLLAKSSPTAWASGVTYTVGAQVQSSADARNIFVCTLGHTSTAGAYNRPISGAGYTTNWTPVVSNELDYQDLIKTSMDDYGYMNGLNRYFKNMAQEFTQKEDILTEYNTLYGFGGTIDSESGLHGFRLKSALGLAKELMIAAREGFKATSFFTGHAVSVSLNEVVRKYALFRMIFDYNVSAENGIPRVTGVTPSFYMFKLMRWFGIGNIVSTTQYSNTLETQAYWNNNRLRIIIINTDFMRPGKVPIMVKGHQVDPALPTYVYTLSSPYGPEANNEITFVGDVVEVTDPFNSVQTKTITDNVFTVSVQKCSMTVLDIPLKTP